MFRSAVVTSWPAPVASAGQHARRDVDQGGHQAALQRTADVRQIRPVLHLQHQPVVGRFDLPVVQPRPGCAFRSPPYGNTITAFGREAALSVLGAVIAGRRLGCHHACSRAHFGPVSCPRRCRCPSPSRAPSTRGSRPRWRATNRWVQTPEVIEKMRVAGGSRAGALAEAGKAVAPG